MEPREVLKKHLELCNQVHSLLLEENTWLKTQKQPSSTDILSRKQSLLPELESSLANLKKLKSEFFSPFDDSKKLVNESHSKLLQIFYLDRENEDLLIKLSQSTERQTFNRFTTSPEEIEDIHGPTPDTNEGDSDDSDALGKRS